MNAELHTDDDDDNDEFSIYISDELYFDSDNNDDV